MNSNAVSVYLSFGSNVGNRQDNLDKALDLLSHRLSIGAVSSLYDTEPVGVVNQPRFLNLVSQVFTRLAPREVLTLTQGIELKMGRAPDTHNKPRPIDIDILFFGDHVIETPDLIIPHPRLAERAFVLVPLAEIAPNLVHPISGKIIKELLAEITEKQSILKWEGD